MCLLFYSQKKTYLILCISEVIIEVVCVCNFELHIYEKLVTDCYFCLQCKFLMHCAGWVGSRNGIIRLETGLWSGQIRVQSPAEAKHLDHPSSCSLGSQSYFPGVKQPEHEADTNLCVMLGLTMLPQYDFMVCTRHLWFHTLNCLNF
jgi:hypothetical protein